jgi:hypothetical protein
LYETGPVHPAGAPGLPGGARHRRRPGIEFRKGAVFAREAPVIGALGRGARLDPGKPLIDIGDKADPALLAIGDDVDAGLRLTAHRFGHRALDPRGERRVVHRLALRFLLDQPAQILGPRQAADMRRQDAIGAALHVVLPEPLLSLRGADRR